MGIIWTKMERYAFGNAPGVFISARLAVTFIGLFNGSLMLLGQAPSITSIAPTQGPIVGGTVVTVTGVNFQGSVLSLDNAPITPTTLSATQISFTTPSHDNGFSSLEITTTAGNAFGEFLFVPPLLKDLPAGYITTFAGVGPFIGFHRVATQASVASGNTLIAFDNKGDIYLAEPGYNLVSVVRPNGILEPFAGSGAFLGSGGVGDGGPATSAQVNFPRGVTTDISGHVYIADQAARVRSVDTSTGIITTIAGNGTVGFSGDGGPSVNALVSDVTHLTGDGKGTIFFIDYNDPSRAARIRKIAPDGIISTVAGTGTPGFSGDGGPATNAQFMLGDSDSGSLALDSHGNLFVADTSNNRIRRIDGQTGIITTFLGPGGPFDDNLGNVRGVAVDKADNVYFDYNGGKFFRIVEVSPSGQTLASYGTGTGDSPDGTPLDKVLFGGLLGDLAIDPKGSVVYTDDLLSKVRRLNLATGLLETVAGVGLHPIGEIGSAVAAVLADTNGDLAFLPTGELLLGDSGSLLLRKIDQNGNISTFAGGGFSYDQQFPQLALGSFICPLAVKTDLAGRIYLADGIAGNIYSIDQVGVIRPLAGVLNGSGFSGDGGPALDALLCQPWDVAVDSLGNLFIADTNNNRIRRVDILSGIITTVAGSGPVNGHENYDQNGSGGFSGDGGPAIQATLNTPYGIAIDAQDNLFFTDGYGPPRIRKIDQHGIISTFATGSSGGWETKLTFDSGGNLYVIQNSNTLIRYDPSGTATVIAGSNSNGFSGDGGPAIQARLSGGIQSSGIAIDTEGNIFLVDGQNLRVRAIRLGATPAPKKVTTNPGRLINLSCRAQVGTGANELIVGFAISSQGTPGAEPLLIRASGPALAPFGVAGVLADPQLTLNGTSGVLATNDGWNGNAVIASAATSVGAFAWNVASSLDSGLVESLPGGTYTAQIAGSGGDTGVALAEVYDATPPGSFNSSSPRLVNLSARVMVGTGGNILIAGFVIGGSTSKTVLIRGSGPALVAFGVPGVLPDPKLQLYRSNSDGTSTLVQTDTGWGADSRIALTAASVGAFSWGSSATPDSAILATLSPGSYTAQVSGASGDTGVALVEVYDVP